MNKESAPEELIKAIRKVLEGSVYVSVAMAERLALDLRENAGRPLHETLSEREFEVLRMLASGTTVKSLRNCTWACPPSRIAVLLTSANL